MDNYKKKVLDSLDVYSRSNTSNVFLKATRLLGFPGPASKRDDIDAIVESAGYININKGQLPQPLDCRALYSDLRSAILECRGNERCLFG